MAAYMVKNKISGTETLVHAASAEAASAEVARMVLDVRPASSTDTQNVSMYNTPVIGTPLAPPVALVPPPPIPLITPDTSLPIPAHLQVPVPLPGGTI